MFTVEFPPGWADPVHRHDAHGFKKKVAPILIPVK
jgi:hypothetical protein